MFICSVRASTVKFAAVLTLGVIFVAALVVFLPGENAALPAAGTGLRFDRISTSGDMARFLSQYGVKADAELFSDREVVLPERFEGVFAEYNELQKKQGFDLSPYAGKKLRRAVLRVTVGDRAEPYLATLYIYRDCVVGGDISSADPKGDTYRLDEFA